MSLIFITLLLLLALFAVLLRKYSLSLFFLIFSFILLFAIGTGLLPRLALNNLQTTAPLLNPEWKNNNAIVVLGFGSMKWPQTDYIGLPPIAYSRIIETAKLYFDCKKKATHCQLFVSGGDPLANGKSEAQLMARDLQALGIAEADISIEPNSNSTFQNAQFVSPMLHAGQFDQVILITSGLHMRRSLLYFSHFLINATPAPSDYWQPFKTWLPVAHSFSLLDMALHEYIGLIRYQIYNMMGWNVKSEAQTGS